MCTQKKKLLHDGQIEQEQYAEKHTFHTQDSKLLPIRQAFIALFALLGIFLVLLTIEFPIFMLIAALVIPAAVVVGHWYWQMWTSLKEWDV